MKYRTVEEVFKRAETVIGKRIGDFDEDNKYLNTKSKGRVGHSLEEFVFGYDINNERSPDFENLGIELKSTGYRWVFKGKKVSAKERLVITNINFEKDIHDSFYESHLYSKIDKILLILYEYEIGIPIKEMVYTNYHLFEFQNLSQKDRIIIEQDYKKIINKIKSGKAHELSEGDTMYLGACTKGQNAQDLDSQPFSAEMAMKRAFSLKTKFMTNLFRNEVFSEFESREAFIKDISILEDKTFEEIIRETFNIYVGKTLTEIDRIINKSITKENNKQFLKSYTSAMMEVSEKNLESLEEFEKASIEIKTIRLEENGSLKESMSFPAFSFEEVAREEWETAQINDFFSSTKFLFVVFQKKGDDYLFKGTMLWNMPYETIEKDVRAVWQETKDVLNSNIELKIKNNRIYNNFPKMKNNEVSHVRPHASNRLVVNPLPKVTTFLVKEDDGSVNINSFIVKHDFTKQCFWLNREFIIRIMKENNII